MCRVLPWQCAVCVCMAPSDVLYVYNILIYSSSPLNAPGALRLYMHHPEKLDLVRTAQIDRGGSLLFTSEHRLILINKDSL